MQFFFQNKSNLENGVTVNMKSDRRLALKINQARHRSAAYVLMKYQICHF